MTNSTGVHTFASFSMRLGFCFATDLHRFKIDEISTHTHTITIIIITPCSCYFFLRSIYGNSTESFRFYLSLAHSRSLFLPRNFIRRVIINIIVLLSFHLNKCILVFIDMYRMDYLTRHTQTHSYINTSICINDV